MILVLCFCWSNPKLVLVNLNRTFYFLGVNFHLLMLEKSKVCSGIQPIWPSCWWFSYEIHLSSTSLEWIKTYWSINPTVLLSVPWCPPKKRGIPWGSTQPQRPQRPQVGSLCGCFLGTREAQLHFPSCERWERTPRPGRVWWVWWLEEYGCLMLFYLSYIYIYKYM